jgi:hypothetical protein
VLRRLCSAATLHGAPSLVSEALADLGQGEPFLMLDDSLGWAWGYAGEERRVGYIKSDALAGC